MGGESPWSADPGVARFGPSWTCEKPGVKHRPRPLETRLDVKIVQFNRVTVIHRSLTVVPSLLIFLDERERIAIRVMHPA